jgi:hypothetical protein
MIYFISWVFLFILGTFLFVVKNDGRRKLISLLQSLFFGTSTFTTLLGLLILVIFMPISIPYSLYEILTNQKKDKNEK